MIFRLNFLLDIFRNTVLPAFYLCIWWLDPYGYLRCYSEYSFSSKFFQSIGLIQSSFYFERALLLILLFTACMPIMAEDIFDDVLKYENIQKEIALEEENMMRILEEDKTKFIENANGKIEQDTPEDEGKEKFEYSDDRLQKVKQTLEGYIETIKNNRPPIYFNRI